MYYITISTIVVLFGAYVTCQESEENCLEGYYTDSDVKGPPCKLYDTMYVILLIYLCM